MKRGRGRGRGGHGGGRGGRSLGGSRAAAAGPKVNNMDSGRSSVQEAVNSLKGHSGNTQSSIAVNMAGLEDLRVSQEDLDASG